MTDRRSRHTGPLFAQSEFPPLARVTELATVQVVPRGDVANSVERFLLRGRTGRAWRKRSSTHAGLFEQHTDLMRRPRHLSYAGGFIGNSPRLLRVRSSFRDAPQAPVSVRGDSAKNSRCSTAPRQPIVSTRAALRSAHPPGANPPSSNPQVRAMDTDLAIHGMDDLLVCDARIFPSCVRFNPIDTVVMLANYAASRILGRA
jgi:choline dehydrogenase-like flavoprotein